MLPIIQSYNSTHNSSFLISILLQFSKIDCLICCFIHVQVLNCVFSMCRCTNHRINMEHYFDCSCYSSDTAGTIQLSECSIPFQDHFMEAWNVSYSCNHLIYLVIVLKAAENISLQQAIESGDFSSFKRSISKMKAVAYHTLTPLDVYCVVEGSGMVYAMTLLALCGFHGRYDMVNSLVDEEGARE